MAFARRLIAFAVLLQSTGNLLSFFFEKNKIEIVVAVVEFTKSKLFDETDFTKQTVCYASSIHECQTMI